MNFLKPEIRLFLIVAVVSAVLAVGGVLLLKAMQQPLPSPTSVAQQTPPPQPPAPAPQPQAPEGWKTPLETPFLTGQTYRSDEFGFEVKYPNDLSIVKKDKSGSGFTSVFAIEEMNYVAPEDAVGQEVRHDFRSVEFRVVEFAQDTLREVQREVIEIIAKHPNLSSQSSFILPRLTHLALNFDNFSLTLASTA